MVEKEFYYIIPAKLVENGNPTKALLYGVIMSLARKNGCCNASNNFLGNKLNKKPTMIRTYLSQLEKGGWIKIENRKGKNRKIKPLIKINNHKQHDGKPSSKKQPDEKSSDNMTENRHQPDEKPTPSNISSNINSNKKIINSLLRKESTTACNMRLEGKGTLKFWCSSLRPEFCTKNKKVCLGWYNEVRAKTDMECVKKEIVTKERLAGFKKTGKYISILTNQIKLLVNDPDGITKKVNKFYGG
jgi:hypothetical protein